MEAIHFVAIVRAIKKRMCTLHPAYIAQNLRALASMACAYATANKPDKSLLVALSKAVKRILDDLDEAGLADAAWAFATASEADAAPFVAAGVEVESVGDFAA